MVSNTLPFLTTIFVPTVVSTLSVSIALICLARLKTVTHKIEIWSIVFICLAVMSWSFTDLLNGISWKLGKAASLSVVLSTVVYGYRILPHSREKLLYGVLWGSSALLFFLLLIPAPPRIPYSLFFSAVIYPQVLFVLFMLYKSHFKRSIRFFIVTAVMGTVMIAAGMYESFHSFFSLPKSYGPLIGSIAFVAAGWYLVVERGYLNTKTWTDYVIEVGEKEKLMEEQNSFLMKANHSTITILTQTIEAKDPYTRGHCLRVSTYSKAIGKALGLEDERIHLLEYGALLHDIGKILIPGKILNKNGKLDAEEFDIIKKHPDTGADILKNVDYFKSIIPMIRHHHESIDGSGYPGGLSGDRIPIEARILAVSDTYDALTSDRPYRNAMDRKEAIGILQNISGSQLDSRIVGVFIEKKIYDLSHTRSDPVFTYS